MQIAMGILIFAIWLVMAYAFLRVAFSLLAIIRMTPAGQKMAVLFDLGFWRFDAVQARIGPTAAPQIGKYRTGFLLFFGGFVPFFILVLINIAISNAAS